MSTQLYGYSYTDHVRNEKQTGAKAEVCRRHAKILRSRNRCKADIDAIDIRNDKGRQQYRHHAQADTAEQFARIRFISVCWHRITAHYCWIPGKMPWQYSCSRLHKGTQVRFVVKTADRRAAERKIVVEPYWQQRSG